MKTVYIESLGCPRRLLDTQKMKSYFTSNGYYWIGHPALANTMILNTCAFRGRDEEKSIERIRALQKHKGKLIVTGCLVNINPRRLKEIHQGEALATDNLEKFDNINPHLKIKFSTLRDANQTFKRKRGDIKSNFPHVNNDSDNRSVFYKAMKYTFHGLKNKSVHLLTYISPSILESIDNVRPDSIAARTYHIRVGWGCSRRCSYCVIWKAVGRLRSKPLDVCVREFEEGLTEGYKEFNILSDNVGLYGLDIGETFPGLLEEIVKHKGKYNISISELDPEWLINYREELKKIIKTKKITRILCPIQSGSNRVLKLMLRRGKIEEIEIAMLELKKEYPELRIDTQVIVGFPTETEKDFQKTINTIKKIGFQQVTLFEYSERPEARSTTLEPKVPKKVVKRRINNASKELKKYGITTFY